MKYLILLIFLFANPNAHAIENDKKLHLKYSFIMSAAFTQAVKISGKTKYQSIGTAILLTMMVGYVKEATDESIDRDDLKYDLLGAITGAYFSWEF